MNPLFMSFFRFVAALITNQCQHKRFMLAALCSVVVMPTFSWADSVPANHATVQSIDRIVAVVNKSVITAFELKQRVDETITHLEQSRVTPPPLPVLKHQVLEQMINEEVQVQYAQTAGVRVSEADLEQALRNLAAQNKMTIEGLKAQLVKQGVSYDYLKNEIKRELLINNLKEMEFGNRIQVSDTEVDQVLKSAQSSATLDFNLASLLVSVPEQADPQQIEALAQKAHHAFQELNQGQPFAKVATAYSDAPNALKGGAMGWRNAASLPEPFVELFQRLKLREHTDVIRTPQGFMIFQLLDKRDSRVPFLVEQYHVKHILIRPDEVVSNDEAKAKIEDIRHKLLDGASFADMAKRYSDDGSKSNGGDLGWVTAEDLVPEFSKVMVSLPEGKLSEPVRTPFGWHLIVVEGHRTEDKAQERQRAQIQQQIRIRKTEQAYTDWLRQLRDSAFVEERLDEK